MPEQRAFAAKEAYADVRVGVTSLPDGHTLDWASRLKNNDGVIVTSDPVEIRTLEHVQELKSVPVPSEKPASRKSADKEA
jgi:hypothetical protein